MVFGRVLLFLVFVVAAATAQQIAVSELNVTFVDGSNISGAYITLSLAPDQAQANSNGWWNPLHIWLLVFASAQILNWAWRHRRNLLSTLQGMPRYMSGLFSREGTRPNGEEAGIPMQHGRLEDNIPLRRTDRKPSTTSRSTHPSTKAKNKPCAIPAELQKPRSGAPVNAPRRNVSIPRRHASTGAWRYPRRSHTRRYRFKPYPGGDLGVRSSLDDDTMSAVEDAVDGAWDAGFGIGG